MKYKKYIGLIILVIFLGVLFFTNPNEEDYKIFSEQEYGKAPIESPHLNLNFRIEYINFYIFSTYTPVILHDEHGITHLGILGKFFKISKGQYDYPKWLEPFN